MSYFYDPHTARRATTRELAAASAENSRQKYFDGPPPALSGRNAMHNDPLASAVAALLVLLEQETAEDEPDNAGLMYLNGILADLEGFWRQEGYERYGDDGGTTQAAARFL